MCTLLIRIHLGSLPSFCPLQHSALLKLPSGPRWEDNQVEAGECSGEHEQWTLRQHQTPHEQPKRRANCSVLISVFKKFPKGRSSFGDCFGTALYNNREMLCVGRHKSVVERIAALRHPVRIWGSLNRSKKVSRSDRGGLGETFVQFQLYRIILLGKRSCVSVARFFVRRRGTWHACQTWRTGLLIILGRRLRVHIASVGRSLNGKNVFFLVKIADLWSFFNIESTL